MCDQTSVDYKHGDIVWVKLRPTWWPGEVMAFDKLPPEVSATIKKEPLATIKFFHEDSYEFVKNIANIYFYNCTKKHEFIKRGLELYRAKNKYMEKFPSDICMAETKTGGDPKILDDPQFVPSKKINYNEIFGTPLNKKNSPKKKGRLQKNYSPSTTKRMSNSSQNVVTHPRFLGKDDHQVRLLVQKDKPLVPPTEKTYSCPNCDYETSRVDIIVLHTKTHIQGEFCSNKSSTLSPKKAKKSTPKSKSELKMPRTKTTSIDEDLDLLDKGLSISLSSSEEDHDDEPVKPKRKHKSPKRKPKKMKKTHTELAKPEVPKDIRTDILAEWEEDSEDESFVTPKKHPEKDSKTTVPNKNSDKSCFDFNEDDDSEALSAGIGRKIPRITSSTEKQNLAERDSNRNDIEIDKSKNVEETTKKPNEVDDQEQIKENTVIQKKKELESSNLSEKTSKKSVDVDLSFQEILDTTIAPKLPEISDIPKFEQNFHKNKPVKIPDKTETHPKKRIVKSFGDFELFLRNEQMKNEKKQKEEEKQKVLDLNEKDLQDDSSKLQPENKTEKATVDAVEKIEESSNVPENRELNEKEKQKKPTDEDGDDSKKETKIDSIAEQSAPKEFVSKLKTQLMIKLSTKLPEDAKFSSKFHRNMKERLKFEKFGKDKNRSETYLEEYKPPVEIVSKAKNPVMVEETSTAVPEEEKNIVVTEDATTIVSDATTTVVTEEATDVAAEEATNVAAEEATNVAAEEATHVVAEEANNVVTEEATNVVAEEVTNVVAEEAAHVVAEESNMVVTEEASMIVAEEASMVVSEEASMVVSEEASVLVAEEASMVVAEEASMVVAEEVSMAEEEATAVISEESINPISEEDSSKLISEETFKSMTADDLKKHASSPKTVEGDVFLETKITELSAEQFKEADDDKIEAETEILGCSINDYLDEDHKKATEDILKKETREKLENFDRYEVPATEAVVATEENKIEEETESITENENSSLTVTAEEHTCNKEDVQCEDKKSVAEEESAETFKSEVKDDAEESKDSETASKEIKKLKSINSTEGTCEDPQKLEAENVSSVQLISESFPDNAAEISNEEMCPLSTLAAVSELSTTFDSNMKDIELKSPEGNLTIMSESELANAEVEIAAVPHVDGKDVKPVTLTNFSMDFSDSNQSDNVDVLTFEGKDKIIDDPPKELLEPIKENVEIESENTDHKRIKLADILDEPDCVKPALGRVKTSVESEIAKLTDTDPNTEVVAEKQENTTSSKLLRILTDSKSKPNHALKTDKPLIPIKVLPKKTETITSKTAFETKLQRLEGKSKFAIKSASSPAETKLSRSMLLPEKTIKFMPDSDKVSVKKVSSKRSHQDLDSIDTFVIKKPIKKMLSDRDSLIKKDILPSISKDKPRILQQTIITASGAIIQPSVTQTQSEDSNMFDINSMPIVLSDQILTPESIENMSIVLSDSVQSSSSKHIEKVGIMSKPVNTQVKLLNKSVAPVIMKETASKTTSAMMKFATKQGKQKIYQSSTKLKNNPSIVTQPGKPSKFVIVPSGSSPTGNKYTVGKRTPIIKRTTPALLAANTNPNKVQSIAETTGNKIMIVTNNQGQQSRVLLTPAQQKMLGYQSPTSKIIKTTIKGNIQKKESLSKTPNLSQNLTPSKTNIITNSIQSSSGLLTSLAKSEPVKITKKPPNQSQRVFLQGKQIAGQQRTVIIKNQQGQTIKKIQGTDNALLEQQVAEQLQAINKAAARKMQGKLGLKSPEKKSYIRKQIVSSPAITKQASGNSSGIASSSSTSSKSMSLPPLTPISPSKKSDNVLVQSQSVEQKIEEKIEAQRPPHQLIIQDAVGNQTTITEGQILALPSETVDGQPQSYMLVTLDETGNLAPLNNEALMSLDPNLSLGSDLGNMVLQIDQGDASALSKQEAVKTETLTKSDLDNITTEQKLDESVSDNRVEHAEQESVDEKSVAENVALLGESEATPEPNSVQGITCSINNGNVNQQLLITGDPASTQKFLETLTEGNADLANLLANAEGNILIHADGQQILINTDADNQMLLMNAENLENNETTGNPVFGAQSINKNQDILAAALADTDVFQPESSQVKVTQSQLSPSNALYPINVGNVLETSAMNSPIMTPLEVPSTNSKKIDEANILSQVPKNVDLPITITDPNISQTVSQQQVASLMANELQSNLELPLSISDPTISVTASEMSSPNYSYSLPTLDDTDINQKAFSTSISMPLLTEEPEDVLDGTSNENNSLLEVDKTDEKQDAISISPSTTSGSDDSVVPMQEEIADNCSRDALIEDKKRRQSNFISTVDDGLCTIRGGICNSLSEPPPDMFDFPITSEGYEACSDSKENTDIPINMPEEAHENSETNSNTEYDNLSLKDESVCKMPSSDISEMYQPFDEQKTDTPSTNTDENSCEIPVQPEIVTDLTSNDFSNGNSPQKIGESNDNKRSCETDDEPESKKCKFD